MQQAETASMAAQWGPWFYVAVAAWTFFEGETIVIVSGALARLGLVNAPALVTCAWLGSWAGDQLWFVLARRYGSTVANRSAKVSRTLARASAILERHDTLFILSYRFVYGLRNVSSLAIGLSRISWTRFALLNLVSAGVWACSFTAIGYLLGTAALPYSCGTLATGAAVAVTAGTAAYLFAKRCKAGAAAKAAATPDD